MQVVSLNKDIDSKETLIVKLKREIAVHLLTISNKEKELSEKSSNSEKILKI